MEREGFFPNSVLSFIFEQIHPQWRILKNKRSRISGTFLFSRDINYYFLIKVPATAVRLPVQGATFASL
jgi:hypothetical protein